MPLRKVRIEVSRSARFRLSRERPKTDFRWLLLRYSKTSWMMFAPSERKPVTVKIAASVVVIKNISASNDLLEEPNVLRWASTCLYFYHNDVAGARGSLFKLSLMCLSGGSSRIQFLEHFVRHRRK